jgi:hypothetical protein
MIPPHPSAFFFWQRLNADYAGMARVFKLQYETVPLQSVLRFRSAEPKMVDFENRSGAYIRVREYRTRRKPPFAGRHHLNFNAP